MKLRVHPRHDQRDLGGAEPRQSPPVFIEVTGGEVGEDRERGVRAKSVPGVEPGELQLR